MKIFGAKLTVVWTVVGVFGLLVGSIDQNPNTVTQAMVVLCWAELRHIIDNINVKKD